MKSHCKRRILIVSGEFSYVRMIALSIKALNDKEIEIVNPEIPQTIKSVEAALALIKENKPDILLLDHFLFGNHLDRIMGKIKPENGEGIAIANETDFFYVGEIKPEIISVSTRSKSELELLYGNRINHYSEGDVLKLSQYLKGKCLC